MEALRPSPEQLAEYKQNFASSGQPDFLANIQIVGDFMGHLMRERGFDEETISQTNFTLGRLCMGRDPWEAFDKMWAKVERDAEIKAERVAYGDTPVLQPGRPEPSKLFLEYLGQVSGFCGDAGIFPQPMLWTNPEGKLTMEAIAADGNTVFKRAIEALTEGSATELVFGMDRSAAPGQGLEFNDFLTVVWYVNGNFYTAIIDYVPHEEEAGQIIREPNWNNNFWNNQLREEGSIIKSLQKALND